MLGIVQETAARESRRKASMGGNVAIEPVQSRPHKMSGVLDSKNHQIELLEDELSTFKGYANGLKTELAVSVSKNLEL